MTENTELLSHLSTETPQVSSAEPTTISTRMKYYDLKKNWHRVKPHLADEKLNDILPTRSSMTFWSETSISSPLADGAGSLLTETFLVNSNPAIGT
jgi:hypothetical protein